MNTANLHKLSLLLCILFSLLFLSCSKEEIPKSSLIVKNNLLYKSGSDIPFTGREKALVENKIVEYDVKDGLRHGEFRISSDDGILVMEGQLDSNRNVGKWKYYFPDGQLESEGYFAQDVPEGKWLWYYPGKLIKEEGNYQKGLRVGTWFQYSSNGNIIYEKNFSLEDSVSVFEDSSLSKKLHLPF
jgi:antitoxin component YwqK of YwqJK toxin-antitoxin module